MVRLLVASGTVLDEHDEDSETALAELFRRHMTMQKRLNCLNWFDVELFRHLTMGSCSRRRMKQTCCGCWCRLARCWTSTMRTSLSPSLPLSLPPYLPLPLSPSLTPSLSLSLSPSLEQEDEADMVRLLVHFGAVLGEHDEDLPLFLSLSLIHI